MFTELRAALAEARRLGARAGPEHRDRLRAAVAVARELIRTAQLRTRAEWRARGHLKRGQLYLEEREVEGLAAADELLRRRS